MSSPTRATSSLPTHGGEIDCTPPPQDLGAMAEVLEGKHGLFAASIADFFALYHGQKGDAGRAWAWTGVAEPVRTRERERLEEN